VHRTRGVVQTSPGGTSPSPPLVFPLLYLPLPFPSCFLLPPLPFLSLPPLRSRPPLIAAIRESGGALIAPPAGPPAVKRYLVNFRLKISSRVATIFRSFSEYEWNIKPFNRRSINTAGQFHTNEHYKTAIHSECTVSQRLFSQSLRSKSCTEWYC